MYRVIAVFLASISIASLASGEDGDIWEIGDSQTIRLPPASFPNLPVNIVKDLESRECLVPQMDFNEQPHNVIRGHFKSSDQLDWAVLCSSNRKPIVLVYWGGSTKTIDELPHYFDTDKDCLAGTGDGKVGYTCGITKVDSKYIEDRARWYGGELPEYLDHEGIDVGLDGKVSMVRYWFEGEWLVLQGAD